MSMQAWPALVPSRIPPSGIGCLCAQTRMPRPRSMTLRLPWMAPALTMDGAGAGNVHAIYFCNNNKPNLKNGSNLTIKNYKQDVLEWDGGDGGCNVNIEGGSTHTSDHCRSGFTGTFIVTVGNSTVTANNKQRSHRHHLHWQGRVQERKCSDFWYQGHALLERRQGAAACRWLDVQ